MLKPTNKNMAKFFSVSAVTISTYRNSKDIGKRRIYQAMRTEFKKFYGINDAL